METTTDSLRLLALHLLERAREHTDSTVSAQESVVRAYNASCCDYQEGLDEMLHPLTDQWITAHHLALGALHEAALDPRLSQSEQLDYATAVLQMLVDSDKASL